MAIAILLVALGGLIAFANWWSLYWTYHTKQFHSAVPLIGAALLGTGMFMLPATRSYCWLALILDYGTVALIIASPRIFEELWNTSRFNLVIKYLGKAGMKTVHLHLFRRGVFTIRREWQRAPGQCGLVIFSAIGKWEREGNQLTLHIGQEKAIFELVPGALKEMLRQSIGFPSWESNDDYSLANIDLVEE